MILKTMIESYLILNAVLAFSLYSFRVFDEMKESSQIRLIIAAIVFFILSIFPLLSGIILLKKFKKLRNDNY